MSLSASLTAEFMSWDMDCLESARMRTRSSFEALPRTALVAGTEPLSMTCRIMRG